MLCVQRVRSSARNGLGLFLRWPRPLTEPLRCQYRYRHDDSHEKIATPTPRPTPASDFLSHQHALFPPEFSEYITHEAPIVPSSSENSKEEDASDDASDSGPDRPVQNEKDTRSRQGEDLHSGQMEEAARMTPTLGTVRRMLSIFLPSHARENKIDLSSTDPLLWEVNTGMGHEPASVEFRGTNGLRKLLVDYLHVVEPHLQEAFTESTLLAALQSTFDDDSLQLLQQVGYDVTDVVSWAWIFTSENVDLAVARYATLSERARLSEHGRLPNFVVLQLLRAEALGAHALKRLIKSILADLQLCMDAQQYFSWNWVTRVCLVVRLLRHARQSAPECFEDISLIVKHLFSEYYMVHPRELEGLEVRRLSHLFNRFLSLISFAPAKTPFNAYMYQQNAQLALVRLMSASKSELPVTREGYRALIAVQLLHRKTAAERTWAEAKSLSWPPWRQINLGIEQHLEFPGRDSRVIKLLRRMQEAGYTLGDWEKSAGILAGWDTDNSPTIQTRAILKRQRRPGLLNPLGPETAKEEAPEVWDARIRATRTTREAWASFRSYETSVRGHRPHYLPYFAMMQKLLARIIQEGSLRSLKYLAGDVKETFEASSNPREAVYVDAEVPSVDEFYHYMLRSGIKPGGNLMVSLLKHSPNAEAGFAYIRDTGWNDITKDILRHGEKYPVLTIRNALNKLPVPTLAAFVSLLCRGGPQDRLSFRAISHPNASTGVVEPGDVFNVSPLTYAAQLLAAADISDIRVWNALLDGAYTGLKKYPDIEALKGTTTLWRRLEVILQPKVTYVAVHPDLNTFQYLARIIHLVLRQRRMLVSLESVGSLAKSTFVRAVYGRRSGQFLPSPEQLLLAEPTVDDLMLMVRVLMSLHDVEGLVALVKWVNEHAVSLGAVKTDAVPASHYTPRADGDGVTQMPPLHPVLCAVQLFLGSLGHISEGEESPVDFTSPLATWPDSQQVRAHSQALKWPSDHEVAVFLAKNRLWVESVRLEAKLTASFRRRAHIRMQKLAIGGLSEKSQDESILLAIQELFC